MRAPVQTVLPTARPPRPLRWSQIVASMRRVGAATGLPDGLQGRIMQRLRDEADRPDTRAMVGAPPTV